MQYEINLDEKVISIYFDNTFINQLNIFKDFYNMKNYEVISSNFISIEYMDNLELERAEFELKEVEEKLEEYLEEYFDDETYWD